MRATFAGDDELATPLRGPGGPPGGARRRHRRRPTRPRRRHLGPAGRPGRPDRAPRRAGQPRPDLRGPVRRQRDGHRRTRRAGTHRSRSSRSTSCPRIAVVPYLDKTGGVTETSPLAATIEIKDRYSAHYGASKWAAESVLHSAQERFGLPVTIFRGDMMLPHRRYHRQVNAPDVFARLLQSLVLTGLAPASFYRTAPDGSRPKSHYDGLPVDFIASAIVAVAWAAAAGSRRSTSSTTHEDDGISLDTVVDWIEAAGYPIQRVDGYDEWFRRFENALHALPDVQRQRSSLSVLDSLRYPAPAQAEADRQRRVRRRCPARGTRAGGSAPVGGIHQQVHRRPRAARTHSAARRSGVDVPAMKRRHAAS